MQKEIRWYEWPLVIPLVLLLLGGKAVLTFFALIGWIKDRLGLGRKYRRLW